MARYGTDPSLSSIFASREAPSPMSDTYVLVLGHTVHCPTLAGNRPGAIVDAGRD